MHATALHRITLALLAAGALGTLAALGYAGGGDLLDAAGLGFVAWALLPYVVLAGGLGRFWSHRARLAGLVGAAVVVLGAAALYADAIWLHPDAQGGLAFVTVPVLQLLLGGATVAAAWWLHRRREAA